MTVYQAYTSLGGTWHEWCPGEEPAPGLVITPPVDWGESADVGNQVMPIEGPPGAECRVLYTPPVGWGTQISSVITLDAEGKADLVPGDYPMADTDIGESVEADLLIHEMATKGFFAGTYQAVEPMLSNIVRLSSPDSNPPGQPGVVRHQKWHHDIDNETGLVKNTDWFAIAAAKNNVEMNPYTDWMLFGGGAQVNFIENEGPMQCTSDWSGVVHLFMEDIGERSDETDDPTDATTVPVRMYTAAERPKKGDAIPNDAATLYMAAGWTSPYDQPIDSARVNEKFMGIWDNMPDTNPPLTGTARRANMYLLVYDATYLG